jgi:hypothetical protein
VREEHDKLPCFSITRKYCRLLQKMEQLTVSKPLLALHAKICK